MVCVTLPFSTVLLNSIEITHKVLPFYNILQKFDDFFHTVSIFKIERNAQEPFNLCCSCRSVDCKYAVPE